MTNGHTAARIDLVEEEQFYARGVVQRRVVGRGELSLIAAIRARAAARPIGAVALGIGDDCAVLRVPQGHQVLVTTDLSMEGRHFDRALHPARSVGHRCLARGLSDISAMGGKPLAAFLSLALPPGSMPTVRRRAWVDEFLVGLLELAGVARTPLAGGDTGAAPGKHVLADIVLVGSVPRGTALRRDGARAGDLLYVTGALGGAAAELELLRRVPGRFREARAVDRHPHLFPEARLRAGWALRARNVATAAIDVSDGLSTDLRHLCEESRVGAVVEADALPVHTLARGAVDGGLSAALHGGEDYELLFAARPMTAVPCRVGGVTVTCIGRFTRGREVRLRLDGRTVPLPAGGWEHAL